MERRTDLDGAAICSVLRASEGLEFREQPEFDFLVARRWLAINPIQAWARGRLESERGRFIARIEFGFDPVVPTLTLPLAWVVLRRYDEVLVFVAAVAAVQILMLLHDKRKLAAALKRMIPPTQKTALNANTD